MRSLRSRLIAGFAFVAVVPLVIGIVLFSRRVESMVAADAARRLDAAVGTLQAELEVRRQELDAKLRILSRDPVLKRLYLIRGASRRELTEHLVERRFLLGLDYLEIADPAGIVIAEALDPGRDPDSSLTLASTAPIEYDAAVVGAVRGGALLDTGFLEALKLRGGVDLVLHDEAGRPAASTLAAGIAAAPLRGPVRRVAIGGRSYLGRSYALDLGPSSRASITGLVPTAAADRTIAELRWTAALLALIGLATAILLALLWSRQISRPVERLAADSRRLAQGDWSEPIALRSVRELETLAEALDRMRADLVAYRERLVRSERQAAWSVMARKVAHEVKNPLTPIAISIADLKRSHEQGRPDFPQVLDRAVRTIGAEVDSLKRLLSEFSEFGRFPAPHPEATRVSELFAGLEALYPREVEAGRLELRAPSPDITLHADPGQVRQALVNLVKNGLEALDGNGCVSVTAAAGSREVVLQVSDTGPGMTPEQRAGLFTPGFTTKAHGSGLGLVIVERIVSEHGGTIGVEPRTGGGTTFRIRLPFEQGASCPRS